MKKNAGLFGCSIYLIRDSRTGLIFETCPEPMAVVLFQDESLPERLSMNALAWAGEFSRDRSAEEFLKAMEGICSEKVIYI